MIDIGKTDTSLQTSLITGVATSPEALSEKECKDILKLIGDTVTLGSDAFEYKFKGSVLPYTDETASVYGRLYDLAKVANDEVFFFEPLDMVENIMYCEFNEGDFIKWHTDMGAEEPQVGRKLGIVVNLSDSDDYRGGDLQFNTGHLIDCPRSMGTVIMYPGFLLQQTTPITKGTRKILIAWFGGANLK
jgi:PKHD-type hydroxylase